MGGGWIGGEASDRPVPTRYRVSYLMYYFFGLLQTVVVTELKWCLPIKNEGDITAVELYLQSKFGYKYQPRVISLTKYS